MGEKSVPVFCRCCSQILQIILDSNVEQNQPPVHAEPGQKRPLVLLTQFYSYRNDSV